MSDMRFSSGGGLKCRAQELTPTHRIKILQGKNLGLFILITTPLPGVGSAGKESACDAGDTEYVGSIPGSGRYPGEANGTPLQYSRLKKKSPRQRCLVGYSPKGLKE